MRLALYMGKASVGQASIVALARGFAERSGLRTPLVSAAAPCRFADVFARGKSIPHIAFAP